MRVRGGGGRRSYGKVYKGRWRGGTVAIKVIAHDGSVASQMSALRESLLCKNITHPNVVREQSSSASLRHWPSRSDFRYAQTDISISFVC